MYIYRKQIIYELFDNYCCCNWLIATSSCYGIHLYEIHMKTSIKKLLTICRQDNNPFLKGRSRVWAARKQAYQHGCIHRDTTIRQIQIHSIINFLLFLIFSTLNSTNNAIYILITSIKMLTTSKFKRDEKGSRQRECDFKLDVLPIISSTQHKRIP